MSSCRISLLLLASSITACPDEPAHGALDAAKDAVSAADGARAEELAESLGPGDWPSIRVNEVQCHGNGEWIELTNTGPLAASAGGWSLTDSLDDPEHAYLLPSTLSIPAGGFAVVRRQTASADGFLFGLKCAEDTVTLLDPEGVQADAVSPAASAAVWSWGRLPDGSGAFGPNYPSPGAPNLPAVDPSAVLFDPFQMVEIDLDIPATSRASLARAPYEYVAATLTITAPPSLATKPLAVGLRLKGKYGSFSPLEGKAGFRIDLDREVSGQRLLGLEHLTLNNYQQDSSLVHEATAYAIFRAMSVPAPRVGHAWIRVDGQAYGVYANIETPDAVFLSKHFASTAHLYEGEYGADIVPGSKLEVDEGDPADTKDLELLASTALAPSESWSQEMAKVADLDEMRRMWAVEIHIGHWDGYAPTVNNYFVHSDGQGVFSMLPWGTDQTFSADLGFLEGNGVLFGRCRESAQCRDAYLVEMEQVLAAVDGLDLETWIGKLTSFLGPWVEKKQRFPIPPDAVEAGGRQVLAFLAARRAQAIASLSCWETKYDLDEDGSPCTEDCNDQDASIRPGAPEICNDFIDQDCNWVPDDSPECPECAKLSAPGDDYFFCHTARTWDEARAQCQSIGAELLVLEGPDEEAALVAAYPPFEWMSAWLGVTDAAQEGTWVTVQGQPATWLPWAENEPNDWGEGEDCVERWGLGNWNDLPCGETRGVVCEGPGR